MSRSWHSLAWPQSSRAWYNRLHGRRCAHVCDGEQGGRARHAGRATTAAVRAPAMGWTTGAQLGGVAAVMRGAVMTKGEDAVAECDRGSAVAGRSRCHG